ncbi:hypothetical protein M8818_003591 [Zalaria obscura]|uniref:Uncharacterized protein n=1 Tax=Zalaria obscura TaxID=2024903 RepID=A0ACC3SFQ6_9PEZI
MLRGYCDFMEGVSGGPEVVIYQLPLRQPCTVEIAVQDRTREVNVTGRAVEHEVLHPETEEIKRLVQEAWMAGEGWTVERLTGVLYTFVKGLEFMQAWRSIPEEEEGEGLYLRADLGMEVTGSAMSSHMPLRTSRSEMQQREVRMLQATGLLEALGVLVG